MRRLLALLALLALTTIAFVGPLAPSSQADTVSEETAFVAKINNLRASKGLGSLTVESGLTSIARNWANEMAGAGTIWHNPSLKDLVTSTWSKLGENVGLGPNIDMLFQAFVNSPHHYDNLVDPAFTHVGVGVAWKGTTMYTAHEFMTLKGGSAPRPPVTAPRVTVAPKPKPAPKPVVVKPAAPPTTTATTLPAPPPPPPPPPRPVPSDRVRWMSEVLRRLDPAVASLTRHQELQQGRAHDQQQEQHDRDSRCRSHVGGSSRTASAGCNLSCSAAEPRSSAIEMSPYESTTRPTSPGPRSS